MPAEHETMTADELAAERDYVAGVIDSPHLYDDSEAAGASVRHRLLVTIARLESALAVARTALWSAADDLEGEIRGRYSLPDGSEFHPAMERKFRRDMSEVDDARAAIETIDAALKGAHPAHGGE